MTKKETALAVAPAGEMVAIDSSYLQPLELPRSGYPALQASKYKNLAEDSIVRFGLSAGAADMIGGDVLAQLHPEVITVRYDKDDEMFYVPNQSIRWVPLNFPKKFIEDNSGEKKTYRHLGGEWNEHCKTVCRLFLAAVDGEGLVLDGQDPAIFSLTLRGMRTQRITGKDGSLLALNAALCKRYNVTTPSYMGHLVSMEITCKASEFSSASDSKLASMGADFVFAKANLLPSNIQAATTALIREDARLMSAIADPFGINTGSPVILEDGDFLF